MSNKKFIESIPVGPLAIVALPGSKALGDKLMLIFPDGEAKDLKLKNHLLPSKDMLRILIF